MHTDRRHGTERGGALLTVLWLSAALAAIGFSVAMSVRGELTRAGTAVEGMRAYYVARGAADRALNYMMYGPGPRRGDNAPLYWEPGIALMRFPFPGAEAVVEVIPESSRLDVNQAPQQELGRLLTVLGLDPVQAAQVAMGIVDWRSGGGQSGLDANYMQRVPSFRAPHASLEQIEELMSVAGITPELFYGGYARTPDGALRPRPGLRECLSIYSYGGQLDINTVSPAVMMAVGVQREAVEQVVALRRRMPILQAQWGTVAALLGPAAGRFQVGGGLFYTLRATARMRRQDGVLSDLRRSVSMTVQLNVNSSPDGFRVLAWEDNATSMPLFDLWPQ